jgi:urease accessory protein
MRLCHLRVVLLLPAALITPGVAFAHTGVGATSGLWHGFAHPLGGLDHVLAMVAVGIVAAQLGGRAIVMVPTAFVLMMAAGAALGAAGIDVPYAEIGIAGSVASLGLAVALRLRTAAVGAAALVGFFALFHGHAHGAEMPSAVSGLLYGLGFVLATVLLHALGVAAGLASDRLGTAGQRRLLRGAGGAMALAGVAMLTGVM